MTHLHGSWALAPAVVEGLKGHCNKIKTVLGDESNDECSHNSSCHQNMVCDRAHSSTSKGLCMGISFISLCGTTSLQQGFYQLSYKAYDYFGFLTSFIYL